MKRVILFAALLAWSGIASAVVYKWVDAHGNVQYGDEPPEGVHAEIVRLLGVTPPAASAETPAPAAQTGPSLSDQVLAQEQAQQEKSAVQEDVAAARKKQCDAAKAHYTQLIDGRHMYKLGPKGEREYLTSEEIDAERLNAKRDVDSLCTDDNST